MPTWALNTLGVLVPRMYLDARRISAWWGIPEGKHPVLTGLHFAAASGDAGLVVQMSFDKLFRIRPKDNWLVPDVHELEGLAGVPDFAETGSKQNKNTFYHLLNAGDSVFPVFSATPIRKSIIINVFNNASPIITFFYELADGGMIFDHLNQLQDIKVVKRQISAGQPFYTVGNSPGDRYFTVPREGSA